MTDTATQRVLPALPEVDVAIIGGGAAGLWLLNLLRARGYSALLCEAGPLGGAQTIASQGMIHGGLKYALGGALTGASEAIARMPERWRRCLAGTGDVDLSAVTVETEHYYMFATGTLGKLSSFFASHALHGRIERLADSDYPPFFRHADFNGTVHRLHDPVLNVDSLLRTLAAPHADAIIEAKATSIEFAADTSVRAVATDDGRELKASSFIFAAGAGNAVFCEQLQNAGHIQTPGAQLRPLHQVFVRHPDITPLFAHCLTGVRRAEPRLTITTHHADTGEIGWYIGGQLATEGVRRDTEAQIELTRRELAIAVPWIDWSKADVSCLRIDRAEPRHARGDRPDEACLVRCANALLAWPTKLSLIPDLGDQLLNTLDEPPQFPQSNAPGAAPLRVAEPPWSR